MPSGRPRKTPGGSSTTRRGYGGEHQTARAKAVRKLQPGEPCPFCNRGMYPEQDLDYDHTIPLAVGGAKGPRRLSHSHCNRSAGAKLGNRMRRNGQLPVTPPVPVQSVRPASGSPCYGCGQPLKEGQRLQPGPAAFGEAGAWMHGDCGRRWTSVPVDRL